MTTRWLVIVPRLTLYSDVSLLLQHFAADRAMLTPVCLLAFSTAVPLDFTCAPRAWRFRAESTRRLNPTKGHADILIGKAIERSQHSGIYAIQMLMLWHTPLALYNLHNLQEPATTKKLNFQILASQSHDSHCPHRHGSGNFTRWGATNNLTVIWTLWTEKLRVFQIKMQGVTERSLRSVGPKLMLVVWAS